MRLPLAVDRASFNVGGEGAPDGGDAWRMTPRGRFAAIWQELKAAAGIPRQEKI